MSRGHTIAVQKQSFLRRRFIDPIFDLLRIGITPRKLAWSIAVGVAIGINPLLGSTTIFALAIATIFRLNIIASQIGNHIVYPLELALFPVFIRIGIAIFHTPPLPLARRALFHAVKDHPWDTTRLLWSWEWHALVVWAIFAAVLVPVLALVLHPFLNRLLSNKLRASDAQSR